MDKIWITRPKKDAIRFIADLRLAKNGIELASIVEPLIEVEYLPINYTEILENCSVGGFIVTSKNGLRGFCSGLETNPFQDVPLFAVGSSTADLARSFGFSDVRVGAGRAEGLVSLIEELDQGSELEERSRFIHLRGDQSAFDLKMALNNLNHRFDELLCYRMMESEALSDDLVDQLKNNRIKSIILMSPRTAKVCGRLINQYNLTDHVRTLDYICLSDAVAEAFRAEFSSYKSDISFPNIHIADFPSQSQLIDCLKSVI